MRMRCLRFSQAITRCGAVLIAFVLCAAPALAADIAERRILGFSQDERIFVFEAYGIQDGSGFPYSDIFFVDLDDDRWLPDTPIRVRLEDDTADLEDARSQALEEAQPLLAEHHVTPSFRLLAGRQPTELDADATKVRFRPRPVLFDLDEPRTTTVGRGTW